MGITTRLHVTIGLAALANVLQLVGFVTPMWIWLDVDTFTVGVGLWFTTGCGIKGTCSLVNTTAYPVSFGYSSSDTYAKPGFKAVQSMETIGFAGGILVLIFLILFRFGYGKWTHLLLLNHATFGTSIITWVCILIGVLVYCGEYWPVVGTSPLLSSNSFPWSMLMCLFAGILFIIVSVLIRWKCMGSEFAKNAIPTSGDSKMDLHPVTKQGLFQRYFAPAFHETRRPNYATNVQNSGFGMNGLMIGARDEPRRAASFDNLAFEDNGLENGVNYRYLPDGVSRTQTQALVRQTLRTTHPIYGDSPYDLHRYHSMDSDYAPAPIPTGLTHVMYSSADRDVVRSGYFNGGGGGGGVTRDGYGVYNDGVMTRDITHQAMRRAPSTRDSFPSVLHGRDGAGQESQERYLTRINVTNAPRAAQTRSYVAGLTDQPRGVNNLGGSRVTNYGRLIANTDYLSSDLRVNDKVLPQLGVINSGSPQQYITTMGPFSPPVHSVSMPAGNIGLYDPPLIYNSRKEEIY